MAEKFVSISIDELVKRGARIVSPEELAERERRRSVAPPALPPTVPPRPGSRDPFFGQINEMEAKRLGLERVELEGNPAAQDVIARIFDQTRTDKFDILNKDAKKAEAAIQMFVTAWQHVAPNISVPHVAGQNYLIRLAQGEIISNLDIDNKKFSSPQFDKPATLFVMDWQEGDYDDPTFQQTKSPLLKELLGTESVVNISRQYLDIALWEGDPSAKIKTAQHMKLITNLGLNPNFYNLRLIAQDEYARLAGAGKNFGKSSLWTWFDDYQVEGDAVHSLLGGRREFGGVSIVDHSSRSFANPNIAVRLVLECTA